MKLSQSQIQNIENYLDYKELEQVDLRYEVLDHMAEAIETAMENGVSYVDALAKEKEKWDPELESYWSMWVGLTFSGSKLMMKKSIRLIKKIYLNSVLLALFFSSMLFFLFRNIPIASFGEVMNIIIGSVCSIPFLILLVLFYKVERSEIKTTFQFLLRPHFYNYGLLVVCFNPLYASNFNYLNFVDVSFIQIFIHIWSLFMSNEIYKMYKEHFSIVKQRLA